MAFGVIFDMDGLMLDTERIARKVWKRAVAEYGYTVTDTQYLQIVGRTVTDAEGVLRDIFGPGFPFGEIYALRKKYYDIELEDHGVPVKPGLIELLDYLDLNAIPRAVASSTVKSFVLVKLNGAGIAGRFDAIVGGDEVERGKPAPDLFLAAARQLGLAPEQCLVLEDSEPGIRAGYLAGCLPVMVPDLKQPSPDVAMLAWRICEDLSRVIPLLEEIKRGGMPAFGSRAPISGG